MNNSGFGLEGVKVGDYILHQHPDGLRAYRQTLRKVTRLTKLHVICEGDGTGRAYTFRKKDGKPPGSWQYDTNRAFVPTPEQLAAHKVERKRRIAKKLVNDINWEKVPEAQLDVLIKMFAPKT